MIGGMSFFLHISDVRILMINRGLLTRLLGIVETLVKLVSMCE